MSTTTSILVGALGIAGLVGCSSSPEEIVPDTTITGCSWLRGELPGVSVTGTLNVVDQKITVGEQSTLSGNYGLQVGCPVASAEVAVEFQVDEIALHMNDAGYPGEVLWSEPLSVHMTASCAEGPPGTFDVEPFGPFQVPDLRPTCDALVAAHELRELHVSVKWQSISCLGERRSNTANRSVGLPCPGDY